MDRGTDWAASTQFSPSKAQAQQAQAKDWASVDGWLSRKYGSKRLPLLERNEETLQILLTLATLNESADEQRGHVDRIEKAALSVHFKRAASADKTYQLLLGETGNREAIDALAEVAVNLDCPSVDVVSLCTAIVDLTSRRFAADQQVQLVDSQLAALRSEQQRAMKLLEDLKGHDFEPSPELVEETSEYLRSAKHMKTKIAEYDDRSSSLLPTPSSHSAIESLVQEADELKMQQTRLAQLHTELHAYQSLPPDAKSARNTLERAREELRKLTTERDRLFERLTVPG